MLVLRRRLLHVRTALLLQIKRAARAPVHRLLRRKGVRVRIIKFGR